jgi:hypothetical protein
MKALDNKVIHVICYTRFKSCSGASVQYLEIQVKSQLLVGPTPSLSFPLHPTACSSSRLGMCTTPRAAAGSYSYDFCFCRHRRRLAAMSPPFSRKPAGFLHALIPITHFYQGVFHEYRRTSCNPMLRMSGGIAMYTRDRYSSIY